MYIFTTDKDTDKRNMDILIAVDERLDKCLCIFAALDFVLHSRFAYKWRRKDKYNIIIILASLFVNESRKQNKI